MASYNQPNYYESDPNWGRSMAAPEHQGTLRQLPIYILPLVGEGTGMGAVSIPNVNAYIGSGNQFGGIVAGDPLYQDFTTNAPQLVGAVKTYCQQQAMASARQGVCGGGGNPKSRISVQNGGASGTGTMAWGITGAIIAGSAFAAVAGWGAAESVLAGSWFLPELCSGGELMWAAFGLGAQGVQGCVVRETRYAWMAKILSAIFITSGTAIATKFNPVMIQQWVKDKLDNFYTFITRRKKEGAEMCSDDEALMNEWLLTQDERFYSVDGAPRDPAAATATAHAAVAAVQNAGGQTWGQYWTGIVANANVSSGGGKRRKSRHRKNKKSKNKKSKRKMAKCNASKRRRNKRNKTRR